MINEPVHEILVLIASVSNEGSDQPAHICSLTRALPAHMHKVWKLIKAQTRERSGSVVECLTRDRRAAVQASPASLCCILEQEH